MSAQVISLLSYRRSIRDGATHERAKRLAHQIATEMVADGDMTPDPNAPPAPPKSVSDWKGYLHDLTQFKSFKTRTLALVPKHKV